MCLQASESWDILEILIIIFQVFIAPGKKLFLHLEVLHLIS